MEKQVVNIKMPEVTLLIGDKKIVVMKPVSAEVSDARDIKRVLKKQIPRNSIFEIMKSDIINALGKGIDVELEDGTVIAVPMHHKWGWQFDIPVSNSMINAAIGRPVPVTYANFVHNALYKIVAEDAWHVSQKATATLTGLGYLGSDLKVTAAGQRILNKLSKVNPATDPSCRMKLARAMFCRRDPTLPAFEFAKDSGYIHYVDPDDEPRESWYVFDYLGFALGAIEADPYWYPTKKGAAWLETNAAKILRHHSASRTRKIDMIPFMPLNYLNEYLASDDLETRSLADRRLQVLKRGGD